MSTPAPQSLRRVLLGYELAFLGLVVVTGAMGGLWAYFWQQTSTESVRLNQLTQTIQDIRSTLFQQIQQVALARLREDPGVNDLHVRFYRQIQDDFNALRRNSASRSEDWAIQRMQEAYNKLQSDLHGALDDPDFVQRMVRLRIFDPRYEQELMGGFESAVQDFRQQINQQLEAQAQRIQIWTRYAPVLLPVPMLLAVVLLYFSRVSLTRGFVRPMQAVITGTGQLSGGDLSRRLPVTGVTEVAQLAESVNRLAGDLAASRDALVESERQAALGALVPVVAHNIRNPLAAIRASAQLLAHLDDPRESREITDSIIATVDRLGRWVSALVSYLHPLKPHPRPLAATTLLEGVLGLVGSRVRERGLVLTREPWRSDAWVEVDADLMEQALYGLLGNAIEASAAGGRLRVGVELRDCHVQFVIEDEAGGIPFQPEPSQLVPGPSTKRFGTGLGIPIAFKVCKAHGWALEFKVTPGQGTRVEIKAPMRQAPDAQPAG